MAEGDKKSQGKNRISDEQRYRYIGFEVFPGKPKDLFKNEAERDQLVQGVLAKRHSDETLREDCILLEERISMGERIILAVASLAILVALVLPWYSVYMVVPAASTPAAQPAVDSSAMAMVAGDTLALEEDSLIAGGDMEEEVFAEPGAEVAATEETPTETAPAETAPAERAGVTSHAGDRANEQIITATTSRAKTIKEYSSLTGIGVFAALGSVGGSVFSSGFILMLTGVIMLVFALLCIALPVLNLYSLFGLKGQPDDVALKLKKALRLNWLPLILFVLVLGLSFVGSNYGFDPTESFTSLGDAYSVAVLLGSLSWGVFVALAASILVAVKGIEI